MNNVTLAEFVKSAAVQLTLGGVEDPLFNIRILVGHALGVDADDVPMHMDRVLTKEEESFIQSLIDRRAKRETLGRIIGRVKFCGLWFGMNEATHEPRTDGQMIVSAIVKAIKTPLWYLRKRKPMRILDLGTGSGCILLSLLHAFPNATGLGVDLAPRAVEQARLNAEQLGLDNRCEIRINNWFTGIEEQFDIVSFNPPYIPTSDLPKLMPAVRDFEPRLALDGGEDGMDPYRIVIPALPKLIKKGGYAGIEMGDYQTQAIEQMLRQAGYRDIRLLIDFRGFDRAFIIRQT
jgi:release factor glutamine methyltransferase